MTDSDADAEPLKLGPKAEYSYKIKLELPAKYTAHAPAAFFSQARLCRVSGYVQD